MSTVRASVSAAWRAGHPLRAVALQRQGEQVAAGDPAFLFGQALEQYQRDLEQETADVADLIRRLREEQPAPEPAEA